MLNVVAIAGYRSLRNIVVPLRKLNLITGANGSGKSSFYRALRLLGDVAQDNVIGSIAREGGLPSTLWAGPQIISRAVARGDHPLEGTTRTAPVSLRMGFSGDAFGYLIDLGMPAPNETIFGLDPEIKQEQVWHGARPRPSTLWVERKRATVRARNNEGEWDLVDDDMLPFDSVVTRLTELFRLRDSIRKWRFYDHFRTDADAPARAPQVGTRTPVLSGDGRDLGAAIQTILEMGDKEALLKAVDDAFPGASVSVSRAESRTASAVEELLRLGGEELQVAFHKAFHKGVPSTGQIDTRISLTMEQPGLLRGLDSSELSDGTLRYLLWIAALLTPRPPELMVLNEPETSLHPDLLPALARLIAHASKQTQVIVVSHAPLLISALTKQPGCHHVELVKQAGETIARLPAHTGSEETVWAWPKR